MGGKHKSQKAPFGIATKRFCRIGFHPNLDVTGAMKKEVTKAGPPTYNPKPIACISKSLQRSPWKNKIECETFSKNLGFQNPKVLRERKYMQSLRGPAHVDINFDNNYWNKQDDSVKENTGFGTGDRFGKFEDNDIPPPDTYYRNREQISKTLSKQFGSVQSFDWSLDDRFKVEKKSCELAPNRYHIRDPESIEITINRSASNKRPLEFFTRVREDNSIKNHFAPSTRCAPDSYYIPPSNLDHYLIDESRKNYGKFLKAERWLVKPVIKELLQDLTLCYRDPDFPGPATYDTSSFKTIVLKKQSKFPFDISTPHQRPCVKFPITAAVGRYSPEYPKCRQKRKRNSWVFLTKYTRDLFKPNDFCAF